MVVACLLTAPFALAGGSDLIISEILTSNRDGIVDEDDEEGDWIEVHNQGGRTLQLSGFALTDDPTETGKWTFPAVSLAPGRYLVVFATGKDRRPTDGGALHTNFLLSSSGEYLALHDASSPRQVLSEFAPEYPPQRTDHSYGIDEAGNRTYFMTPTPGEANGAGGSFAGFVADPRFSAPHGLHSGALDLEITSPTPGAAVYYTLDGTEPTAAATLYSGPLPIAGNPRRAVTTVRAVAMLAGYLPSNAVTSTYIFPEHVLHQPSNPDDFPSTWGSSTGTTADYEMDPDVAGNPAYTERALEGLASIPTMSIVLEMDDLFGRSRGIYSNPSFEGSAWERACSTELMYPDGRDGFQANCGLRIQGGTSTENWKAAKLSLRLLFKGDYGPRMLDFPLFARGAVESFNTLILDAHLNLTWVHPDHGQRVRSQYIRDPFVSDLQNALGSLAPHSTFVHLYLNGLYWGVYDLHEKPDEVFQEEYFGGDADEYDVLRHTGSEVVNGSSAAWNTMINIARAGLATDAQYRALQGYLDVEDLIDYMLVNIYAGNDDWPRHNWYAARLRAPGAQFRFFSWDAEHVLKDAAINQTGVNLSNSPAELYDRLRRQNAEFRLLFADHVQRHFFNGGPLHVDPANSAWDPTHPERNRPAALYMERAREVDTAIILESARWGDNRRPEQPYTRDAEWQAELNFLLGQYFPQRSATVLAQLRAAGLFPAVGAPLFNQHGGPIAPGFQLTMARPAGTDGAIHYTLDGRDPRAYGTGSVDEAAREYTGALLLDDRAHVKARVLDGAVWSALSEAIFTVASPAEYLRITEIQFNPGDGEENEFIELKNTGSLTLDLGGVYFSNGIAFLFEPGASLGPGAFAVLAADAAAFAERHPGVPLAGVYDGQLANNGEEVTLRDAGGNVIVSADFDDEGFWPVGPDGFGWSLVIVDPACDADDPENWRASAEAGGSPGADDPGPEHGGIAINEVLARASGALEDAVELRNLTGSDVSIGGWYLSNNRDGEAGLKRFRIPEEAAVPARGFLVLYENQFNPTPGVTPGFEFDAAGGAAYLAAADPAGRLTGYIVGAEFPAAGDGTSTGRLGTSTGVDFTALGTRTFGVDSPASVAEFRNGNGEPNALPLVGPVVINEVFYHPAAGGDEFLELHNRTGIAIALHDPASGAGWRVSGLRNFEESGDFEFAPGAAIPAGGYLLVVGIDPVLFRSRHGIPAAVPIHGPFGGALDNSGERLKVLEPEPVEGGAVAHVVIDHVRYNDRLPWPEAADGAGWSLERLVAGAYGNEPLNWGASLAPGGSPGRANGATQPGGNQPPVPVLRYGPQSQSDPMVLLLDASDSYDPDGTVVRFDWDFGDGEAARGASVIHAYESPGVYTVRLVVVDNRGAESGSSCRITVAAPPAHGAMVPGDCNRDGELDLSDPLCLLFHLFLDSPAVLPCGGSNIAAGGNLLLLSTNGDQRVDVTDALHVLNFLFLGGPPPALGAGCKVIEGCPPLCSP